MVKKSTRIVWHNAKLSIRHVINVELKAISKPIVIYLCLIDRYYKNLGFSHLRILDPPPLSKVCKTQIIVYIDIVAHALYSYARKPVESESI